MPCKLVKNAQEDPDWDPQSNAELCRGYDCETCPHNIKGAKGNQKVIPSPDLVKKLLKMDKDTFTLVGEIFVNSNIKFCKSPVFKPTIFNINILKEMNTSQLKFLMSLVNQELDKCLWKNNEKCPNCGQEANQEIRACETGYSYCSEKCASEHVNNTYVEEED